MFSRTACSSRSPDDPARGLVGHHRLPPGVAAADDEEAVARPEPGVAPLVDEDDLVLPVENVRLRRDQSRAPWTSASFRFGATTSKLRGHGADARAALDRVERLDHLRPRDARLRVPVVDPQRALERDRPARRRPARIGRNTVSSCPILTSWPGPTRT